MQRVLVIGPGGAGKSTFARRLAQITGLPLVHLDALHWRAGWVQPERSEWEATVERLIAQPRWILDGHFGATLERRLAACDTVVYLDLPPLLCLWRVLKRRIANRGRAREGMAPGCIEKLDASFLGWILSFRSTRRAPLLERLARLRPDQRAVILRRRREVQAFLAALR
jgi:adenylate kinase family enzyme